MSRVEWSLTEPGTVEQLVGIFLCRENPRASRIRPSRGDGGIDVLIPEPDNPRAVAVYQVKCFHQNLTRKQKGQIERSYQRLIAFAAANGLTVKAWYLTLPLEPTNENRDWFLDLTREASFPCEWRGLDYLEGLAAKYPDVVDYYLHDGKQRLDQAVVALTKVLRLQQRLPAGQLVLGKEPLAATLQPGETVNGLVALHEALNKHDPHYRYDFSVDHERPQVPDAPYLLAVVQQGDANRCVTFKIFARFAEAVVERPVPGSVQFVAEPGSDLHRDLDMFCRYGRPFEAPAGSFTAEFDLPGGLGGGPFEAAKLKIGPAATDEGQYELRLSIIDEAGTVLAEPLVRMEPVATGQSARGVRGFGVEENGVFSIEMLTDLDTRQVDIRLDFGDLAGRRPDGLLEGLRFLADFRHPHKMGVRPAYGPGRGEPIKIPESTTISGLAARAAELFHLAEALVEIQDRTPTRVEMPDPDRFTRSQMSGFLDAARLLRGETLTRSWTSIGPVHLHPGKGPELDARFALLLRDSLTVALPSGEIELGVRNIHLPAAYTDPESVIDHEDHQDVQFKPAGDALAVITLVGSRDTEVFSAS